MSLINQVLSDLEKRGAGGVPSESAIRPVAVQADNRKVIWLLAGLLGVSMLVAAGVWWRTVHLQSAATESTNVIRIQAHDQEEPASSDTSTSGTVTLQKDDAPALILSSELSSIPLPSSLRNNGHGQYASADNQTNPATLPAAVSAVTSSHVPSQESRISQSKVSEQAAVAQKIVVNEPKVNPVLPKSPLIASVSPEPVITNGAAQPLTIIGNNFSRWAAVTLRSPSGQTYANRPVVSRSATQLLIKPSFGSMLGDWTVEVVNPDRTVSGKFLFKVQGQPVIADNKVSSITSLAPMNKALTAPPVSAAKLPGSVDKQIKQLSPQQQADNEFRKANILLQQGRVGDAISGYAAALQLDAGHDDARQAMVSVLLDHKRNADAESALQEGLNHNPKQIDFAKLLARLQVDRGALPQALETLEKALPYAGQQADFHAFIAAVQQRMGQHKEAIVHYRIALQSSPDSGVWLMGLGISLKALQQHEEARTAFKRALDSHTLNEELQAFVMQQLKEL
jgi:MSHA biogenesis protein MshN